MAGRIIFVMHLKSYQVKKADKKEVAGWNFRKHVTQFNVKSIGPYDRVYELLGKVTKLTLANKHRRPFLISK